MSDLIETKRKEFYEIRTHSDGCLYELEEVYGENHGVNSCTCGLDKQWDWIAKTLKEVEEKAVRKFIDENDIQTDGLQMSYEWLKDVDTSDWL